MSENEKKLKFGIIGTGWIAQSHAVALHKLPDVEVVALADLVQGKAEAFGKEYGFENARCYESDAALLDAEKDLDAVCICTYNCQHAPCTINALKHGVHVMLEKPFTVTLEEAIECMKVEKETGKVLTIGFQPRMSKNLQIIKEIIASGELGDIYYMQSSGGRRYGIPTPYGTTFIEKETAGIGALADLGCYSIDMLMNAVGNPKPISCTGYTSDFFGKDPESYPGHPEYAEKFNVDDFAAAFVRLEGGIVFDFRISWSMHMDPLAGDAIILGTKGGMRIPNTGCWNGDFSKPVVVYKKVGNQAIEYEIPFKDTANKQDLFYLKLRSFADAIKNGGKAPVPTSEIIYNQAIISAIAKSAELGEEVKIEIPEI